MQKAYKLIIVCLCLMILPKNSFADVDLLKQGIEEYRGEQYEEALETLSSAVKLGPESSQASFYLGLTLKQMGDYRGAEKAFRAAMTLKPPVLDAYIELIEVLYTLDALQEAKEWIVKAETAGVNPAQVSFLKGLILSKEGRTQEAIKAFRRAKEQDRSVGQSADLQIAMAQVKERQFSEAKKTLAAVADMDPGTDIGSFAREYERALVRSLEAVKKWQLNVGLAYQYDDNVILKPTADIPGIDITGEGDSSIISTLGITYTPMLNGPWALGVRYNFYSNIYSRIKTHNLLIQTVSLVPAYNMSSGVISVPLAYSHIWVHEKGYLGLFTAKPTLQVIISPEHIGQITVGYGKQELLQAPQDSNENRNANIYSVSAGYMHPLAKGRGMFNFIYEHTLDKTEGRNWENTGNRLTTGLLLPLWSGSTNMIITGDALLQDYRNIHTVFEEKRQDRIYTGSVGLSREISRGLTMNLQYSHTRANSNIVVYDYTRNIFNAGLEYRF